MNNVAAESAGESNQKKLRALKKKLREIVDIENIPNDTRTAEQATKLLKRTQIEEEIRQLENSDEGLAASMASTSLSSNESARTTASNVPITVAIEGSTIGAPLESDDAKEKKIKAAKKKLKQIDDLEIRQFSGVPLDEDQVRKVAQKLELQRELDALVLSK
jgi:uncharacterized protein with WD repeat